MSRDAAHSNHEPPRPQHRNLRKRKHAGDTPVDQAAPAKKSRRQKKQRKAASAQSPHHSHLVDAGEQPKQRHSASEDVQLAPVSTEGKENAGGVSRRKRKRKAPSDSMPQAEVHKPSVSLAPKAHASVRPTPAGDRMSGTESASSADGRQVGSAERGVAMPVERKKKSDANGGENLKGKAGPGQVAKTDWSALLKGRSSLKGPKKPVAQAAVVNAASDSGAAGETHRDGTETRPHTDANGSEQPPNDAEEDERLERTVFVGNVPRKARQKDIKKLFKPFGRIESVRIRGVTPANPKLPKKMAFLTGKFAQFADSHQAYVVFAGDEGSEKAMGDAIDQLNMTTYLGHHLRVKYADTTKRKDRNVSVFVGNLPFDCGEDELIETFQCVAEQIGVKIMDARVNRDTETGVGRGIGFVTFNDSLAVQACLNEADKLQVRGRPLRIEPAEKEKKINTKTFKDIKRGSSRYHRGKKFYSRNSRQYVKKQ